MKSWLMLLLGVVFTGQAHAAVTVENGWVREAPPGATVMAGYALLRNDGDQIETLCTVRSPEFGAIEFHRITQVDGQSRMRAEDQLHIPAQGELSLAPGGLHFMLFRPTRPLRAGDTVTLELGCDGKILSKAQLTVRTPE